MKSNKKESTSETRIVKQHSFSARRSSLRKINESTKKVMRRFRLSSRMKRKKRSDKPKTGKEETIITNSIVKITNDIPNLLHSLSSASESTIHTISRRNLFNNPDNAAILLVDPKSRIYEILSCQLDEFDDDVPVTTILDFISESTTDEALKDIEFTGLINLNGTEFPPKERLKDHIFGGELLIAKTSSRADVEFLDLANLVLENPKLASAVC